MKKWLNKKETKNWEVIFFGTICITAGFSWAYLEFMNSTMQGSGKMYWV